MAYTADVYRWRGPVQEPYRPHMFDTPWHPGWIVFTVLGFAGLYLLLGMLFVIQVLKEINRGPAASH